MLSRLLSIRTLLSGLLLVLAGLGFVGVYWASSPLDNQSGTKATARNWVAGYLFGDNTVGQTVDLQINHLVGIRFWLMRPVNPGDGTVVLRVLANSGDEEFGRAEVAVSDLREGEPTLFLLSDLPGDPVNPFATVRVRLQLEAQLIDRASAVSVIGGGSSYATGSMQLDGQRVQQADIAFETVYQSTQIDRFFPISRIAYGRPGIFSSPQLYALALYSFCLVCLFSVGQFWWLWFHERPAHGKTFLPDSP